MLERKNKHVDGKLDMPSVTQKTSSDNKKKVNEQRVNWYFC